MVVGLYPFYFDVYNLQISSDARILNLLQFINPNWSINYVKELEMKKFKNNNSKSNTAININTDSMLISKLINISSEIRKYRKTYNIVLTCTLTSGKLTFIASSSRE